MRFYLETRCAGFFMHFGVTFLFHLAKLTAIFCDNLARVDSVLKNSKEFGTLKHIIVAQQGDVSAFEKLKEKGELLYFSNCILDFLFSLIFS